MEATTGTLRMAEVAGGITVLFTDVAGSTELLSDLGDEAMERCWREHFAVLRAEVATHRGREVKSMGDGLMVVFDSPADALACAIAMQTAVAGHARAGGPALRMRVGLHCGPTIEREGDHRGTTVVVAHRLCDVAQPGEILATAAVIARAAPPRGSSRDLGDLTLKGLSEHVPVHAVQWARAPGSRLAEREPLGIELAEDLRRAGGIVGRHREVERLSALWSAAAAGRRQLLIVAGEPGIGKTSLVAELARVVQASGAVVLYGRCDEGFATPLQPVAEALRQLVAALTPTRLRSQLGGRVADLARLLPELSRGPAGAAPRSSSDPQNDQRLMFEAVSQLLATTARGTAVLVVLEDLHWADAATVALLRHIVAAQAPAALAVVATVRDAELAADHPLRGGDDAHWLALGGLDAPELAALIEADGGRRASRDLAEAVGAATGGNPLHARELVRAWTDAGSILVRERALELADGEAGAERARRPDVGAVLERRVGALPAATRRVLTLGSVLGRGFSLGLLGQILVADEPADLADAVQVAVSERLLVGSDGGERYAFAHALIRQSLYVRIGATRRALLHRQVADAIEEAAGDAIDAHVDELAYHYARCAGEARATKAVDYALRAGWASLDRLVHERAAVHFATALELLGAERVPGADTRRCDATIGLGECQRRAGEPVHRATLLAGARMAEQLGDGERLARAALANGRGFFSAVGVVDHERVAVLRAALAACDDDGILRARLLAQLAMEVIYEGDWDARAALSDEAVALARRLGDAATFATVLYQRSVALWGVHGLEQRRSAVAEAERQLDWLADPLLAVHIAHQGVHAALASGDMALADRRMALLREHAANADLPTLAWYERVAASKRAVCAGRMREALALAFEARDIGTGAGQPDAVPWWGAQTFGVGLLQGRLQRAKYDAVLEARAQCPTVHRFIDGQLACLQIANGDRRDARDTLDRVMAGGLADVPADFAWIGTIALASYACWQLGATEHADELAATLAPWAGHFVEAGPTWLGSASFFLGLLATTRRRPEEARAYLERAQRMHERCHAPAHQAHTLLARAQLEHEHPGAARAAPVARELATRARTLARELDLPGVERGAERVLAVAG